MKSLHEFWMECQDNAMRLQAAEPASLTLFGQFAAIAYTQMKWTEDRRKNAQSSVRKNGRNLVVRIDGMGRPDGDGCGRIRRQDVADDLQKEARDQQDEKGGQGQEGGEKGEAEEQEMSDLCHMRKMERGRILYCLDYLIRSLNDEEAQARWLEEGCPDGTITERNLLTEDQVEDHAEFVNSQEELDEYVALATKILFMEVFSKAWKFLISLPPNQKREMFSPERCVLT